MSFVDCPECGRLFAKHNGRATCSDECKRIRKLRDKKRQYAAHPEVIQARVRARRDAMTDEQRDRLAATRKAYTARVGILPSHTAGTQARRARKYGVTAVKIDPQAIAERDRWRCGICGKRIPKAAKWPDHRSLSLDHIVPLAEGGDHVPANVRVACLICNIRRGTRGGNEQLALIG